MKKIYFIFNVLLLNLIFVNITKYDLKENCVAATTSNNIEHKNSYSNYMDAYFDNLTLNLGGNTKGSCGYVALGMILSYYDNYLNDDIIEESYDIKSSSETNNFINERNSPGVFNYQYFNQDKGYGNYYKYILSSKEYDFESKLISMGISKGYHEVNASDFGTNIEQRETITKTYLNERGFNYTIEKCYRDELSTKNVRDFAIENVKKGYPVLLAIEKNGGGHAVVAYDYDSSNDKLYCHFGWMYYWTHINPEDEGYSYRNAMVLKINGSHSHSNNYVYNNKSYCYCSHEIITYEPKTHPFSKFTIIDSSNHLSVCSCGLTQIDRHNFVTQKIGSKTYSICKNCKYKINSDEPNIISEVA